MNVKLKTLQYILTVLGLVVAVTLLLTLTMWLLDPLASVLAKVLVSDGIG
jgi:hypothetical protein